MYTDDILIDLFLPMNQNFLDGKLNFCRQPQDLIGNSSQAALCTVIIPPMLLDQAVRELVEVKLVKTQGRELWVHREIQEATIHHSSRDLQGCFDSASALVYEAFPKQVHGDYLSDQRGICETYISHAIHLSLEFNRLNGNGKAKLLRGYVVFPNGINVALID